MVKPDADLLRDPISSAALLGVRLCTRALLAADLGPLATLLIGLEELTWA